MRDLVCGIIILVYLLIGCILTYWFEKNIMNNTSEDDKFKKTAIEFEIIFWPVILIGCFVNLITKRKKHG